MIQTYTEKIKYDVLHIELLAYLDNGWSVSECYEIPIINIELFQTEKNLCVAKTYEKFNKAIAEYILKPQTEGTLPPTEVNSKVNKIENIFKGEMMPQMGSVPHKKVADRDAAWEVQEQYKGQPHGWVQWKGTEVCMDIHCKCGNMFHIDASFAYFVKCPTCETIYMCNGHIELIEIDKEPDGCVVMPD